MTPAVPQEHMAVLGIGLSVSKVDYNGSSEQGSPITGDRQPEHRPGDGKEHIREFI